MEKIPHDKPRKPVAEFPNQPSPPIAWSSPANSPLPASVSKPDPSDGSQFETREFRLSDYPPGEDLDFDQDVMRPSSQPAVEVSSRPTPVPPRPSSHNPAASRHTAPARKCWDLDVAQVPAPPPLVYPDTASMDSDTKQEHKVVHPPGGGTAEIEVEIHSPCKKGLAMFIGDDAQPGSQVNCFVFTAKSDFSGRRGGLMVGALDSYTYFLARHVFEELQQSLFVSICLLLN